jgi:hypothetical protein
MERVTASIALACAYLLSGCALFQTKIQPENSFRLEALTDIKSTLDDKETATTSPDAAARLAWHRAQAIQCSDRKLKDNDGSIRECSGLIRIYLESAITASNQACNVWFDWLIYSDVETTYAKNLLNIAGNSAQALMGLTGDSPTQIGKVALALGLGNSTFDSYRAVYLMSPTLHKIRKQIDDARRDATDAIRTNLASYKSWDDADEDAQNYHKSCSREAIQEILNVGIAVTSYKAADLDSGEIAYNEANQQIYQLIFGARGQFSDAELMLLVKNPGDEIFKSTPAATNPLVKTAQEKFNALDQKGKSDFQRWLETAKKYLDAKSANAKAKKVLAETKATDDSKKSDIAKNTLQLVTREVEMALQGFDLAIEPNKKQSAKILVDEKKVAQEYAKKEELTAAKRAQESMKRLAETAEGLAPYGASQKTRIRFEAVVDPKKLTK